MNEENLESAGEDGGTERIVQLPAWKLIDESTEFLVAQFVPWEKLNEEGKGACSLSGLDQHLIDGIVLVPVNYVKPSEDGSVEPLPFLEKCIPNREWYILVTGTEETQELHAFTVCPKWSVN